MNWKRAAVQLALFGSVHASILSLWAQDCSNRGQVRGKIVDPSNALIVGAPVHAVQQSNGIHLETKTNQQGVFDFPCMTYGTYQIQAFAKGFSEQIATAVVDGIHPEASVILTLNIAPENTTINVDGNDDLTGTDHSGGSNVIKANALSGFAEDPDDFLRQLQSLAAASGGGQGPAIVTVDGFQNSSPLPPKSSIREIHVNPDLFSAEYGKAPYGGGRIEVYTKPGQAAFHGDVYANYGGVALNARDSLAMSRGPSGKQRYGLDLSGPLFSKKHSFNLSLEHRSISETATVNATILDTQLNPSSFIENVPTPQSLWLGTVRSDWELGAKDDLTASFSGNMSNQSNLGVGGFALASSGYHGRTTHYDFRIQNTQFVSSRLLHSSRFGFTWKDSRHDPNSSDTSLQIAGAFTGGGSIGGLQDNREFDLELDDDILLSTKRHTLKLGIQTLGGFIRYRDPDTFNGSFLFGGGLAPSLDSNNQPIQGRTVTIDGLEQYRRALLHAQGGTPTTYSLTHGNPIVPFDHWTVAVYAQDQWKLNDQLSLSYGLRYFAQTMPNVGGSWAPRAGVAWSPDKNRKWTLHARLGMFYNPIDTATTLDTVRLDGKRQTATTYYSPSYIDPVGSNMFAARVTSVRRFASGTSLSPSVQAQLGADHMLSRSWSASASLYWTSGWATLRSRNVNAPIVDTSTQDPLSAPRPIAPNLNIFEFQQSGRVGGPVVFAGINHFGKRFTLITGYIYLGLRSNADTPATFPQSSYSDNGNWARPSWESSHRAFTVLTVPLPWKTSFSSNLDAASGLPYDVTTGFDNNGDGSFNDRPAFTTLNGSGVYDTTFGRLTTNAVNGNLRRNAGTAPFSIHLDSSLTRDFKVGPESDKGVRPYTIGFTARSANILNHTNVTTVSGILGTSRFGQPITADYGRRIEFGLRFTF